MSDKGENDSSSKRTTAALRRYSVYGAIRHNTRTYNKDVEIDTKLESDEN